MFKSNSTYNKIKYSEKNKIDIDSIKKIIRNNNLILQTQQQFKSERHNVFTEEINTIALSSNDDKRMHYFWQKNYITAIKL